MLTYLKQSLIKQYLQYQRKRDTNITHTLNYITDYIEKKPGHEVPALAFAYDIISKQKDQSRYALYQNRFFDFNIKDGDKVLDIGSGHIPFPFATVLADLALTDHNIGRAGIPFKYVDDKPVYECSVEKTPFKDKEFDFVYCSHVLEHVDNPAAACKELMRIGKKGYIETPHPSKDFMFSTAKISNHKWGVTLVNDVLTFAEYTPKDIEGLGSNLLMDMNCKPNNMREKALAALDQVYASRLNTMFLWDDSFQFTVNTIANNN